MDEKAANDGDKLKHSLLIEVLASCKAWNSFTYAESHAGAGLYFAADQDADKPHITNLFTLLSSQKDKPSEEAVGGRFYHLLQNWRAGTEGVGSYPGSVLQAARFLSEQKVIADFRVTEAEGITCDRLVKATYEYGVRPVHEKFQNKIDWLTEEDPLVLLIDPLSFGEDFGKDRHMILNNGGMDIPTLTKVLNPCWRKKAAVDLLWSGFGHKGGHVKRGIVYGWLKCLCEQQNASFSCYHAKSYYTFVIGIGEGKRCSAQLLELDWSKSWLSKTIKAGL